MIEKFTINPLVRPSGVKPSRPDFEVVCAFNPGATRYGDETLLMMRVAARPIAEKGWLATAAIDPQSGEKRVLRFKLDDPELKMQDARVFSHRGRTYLTT